MNIKNRTTKILIFLGIITSLFSCKEDKLIDFIEENSDVYFSLQRWTRDGVTYNLNYTFDNGVHKYIQWYGVKEAQDSIAESFALKPSINRYDTIYVPVSLLGYTSDVDRTFGYSIDPLSDAREGADFVILESKIPANKTIGAIAIQIDREGIKDKSCFVDFKLEDNNEFKTRYNTIKKSVSDTTEVSLLEFRVRISDFLEIPPKWGTFQGWYGPFSRKKMYLVAELTGEPLDEFYASRPSLSTIMSWAQMLKRYLQKQEALGTPVLEDDGTPMVVGQNA